MRLLAILIGGALTLGAAAPQRIAIGNQYIERAFEIRDGKVRTVSITNQRTHRLYPVESREFEMKVVWERMGYDHGWENPVVLTANDFTLKSFDQRPGELVFHFANNWLSVEADLTYTLAEGDFFLRKQLTVRSVGRNTHFVEEVALESMTLPGATFEHGGFGQPLYAGDLFLGVEYPGGYNTASHGAVRLWYYGGQTTSNVAFTTERAVVGAGAAGPVRDAFMQYVGRIRSGPVRPVTVFNTWYDMQNETLTETSARERMATLKAKLLDPFGLRLDSFVLDDGWDTHDKLWTIHPVKFHGDFRPLVKSLTEQGSSLGLWYGPIGGYGEGRKERLATGRRDGYEITTGGRYFCLAGTQYHELFKRNVLDMVQRYQVTHFKFDGLPFGCNDPSHGHLMGIHSREAHLRAFIDILKAIRNEDRRVFLNITTSMWLSPWWLQYTDVVFMGGLDYGFLNNVPALTEREKAITYRDKVLYDGFRKHAYQFPQNSLMTIGIIKGTLGHEGGLGETLASFTNNAIMNYSRGVMMTELYLSPAIINAAEWRALGGVMKWGQANADVLLHDSRFVGGDPGERSVYGYSHFREGRGIVTLRNPVIEPQTFKLALDESAGVPEGGRSYHARIIYPFTETLPGEYRYKDTASLTLEGHEVQVVEFSADALPPSPTAVLRAAEPRFEGNARSFKLTLNEPRRLAVLCESNAKLTPRLRDSGQELKFTAVSPRTGETNVSLGGGGWMFLVAELAAGEHRIEMDLAGASSVAAYVVAATPIADTPIPAPGARERRVVHLFTKHW
jgi:hypothetical protein